MSVISRIVLLCGVVLAQAAIGKAVTPLAVEDALDVNEVWGIALSPDGRQLAYTTCDARRKAAITAEEAKRFKAMYGWSMWAVGCDIWVSPMNGGAGRNVSVSGGNSWLPAWSPDGQHVAFYSDRDGAPRLWVWDVKTRSVRRVSEAVLRPTLNVRPMWLPDSQHLFVRLRPEGKSAEELGEDLPGKFADHIPLAAPTEPGSTAVVLTSGESPKKTVQRAPEVDLSVLWRVDLSVIALNGGEVKRIARDVRAELAWLSPNGKHVMYCAPKPATVPSVWMSPCDLTIVDTLTGASRVIAADVYHPRRSSQMPTWMPTWSPDSRHVAFLSAEVDAPIANLLEVGEDSVFFWGNLHVASIDGEQWALTPTEKIPGFSTRPLWSGAGDTIYVMTNDRVWGGSAATRRVAPLSPDISSSAAGIKPLAIIEIGATGRAWSPPSGTVAVSMRDIRTLQNGVAILRGNGQWTTGLTENKKYTSTPIASADGKSLVYRAESAATAPDYWTTTSRFTTPVRVSNATQHLEKYVLGESRLVEYQSAAGQPLRAALLLPAGYEKGKRYPMLVWVYASTMGSNAVNDFGLVSASQYMFHILSTRGYAVLFPDIPVKVPTPVQDMMNSVMPAIDKVVEMGVVDPDRLAVSGQSNGGYTTLALISHTTRFKAAIMNAGFGDLTALYGAMTRGEPGSDENGRGFWQDLLEQRSGAMGVPPWVDPQRYVANSPIYRLDRIETPLIMQAGAEDDYIVPYSDQVFAGLKRLNKDVIYLRYEKEHHTLVNRRNQLDYWNRVLPFLDRHLKGVAN